MQSARRHPSVRARQRKLRLLAAFALVAVATLAWRLGAFDHGARQARPAAGHTRPSKQRHATPARPRTADPHRLQAVRSGSLRAPLQDAATARFDSAHALVLGGLSAADASTAAVSVAGPAGDRVVAQLPYAVHDSAAVRIGPDVYLFGGGTGSRQLDQIVRVDRAGRSSIVGHLPAQSSDQSAAAINGTAYVVGGYTGSRWLSTVVAWRPGTAARLVARLPTPLRYAAITAVGNRLLIAGGSLPNGTASDAVFQFRPAGNRVSRLGRLPAPTTHASAASIGGTAYVIGGRGTAAGTPTARIVAIRPGTRTVVVAGRLPRPLSDLASVTLGHRILVVGGRSARGTVAALTLLAPTAATRASPRRSAKTSSAGVYAHARSGMLAAAARAARPAVYVPNSESGTVDVIDPTSYRVVRHFAVGALPQHVTPAYDLRTLYVDDDVGNTLTPIDPRTRTAGHPIPVADPYNLYFTPDGRRAIVVAERLHRLDFRTPGSFRLDHSLPLPCAGPNHLDFSADGRYAIVSCEFSGQLVKVDVTLERVVAVLQIPRAHAVPQDVRLSPDGRIFYVTDLAAEGVWEVSGSPFHVIRLIHTGAGAHGLVVSRNGRLLYVANRNEGSVSVISFAKQRQIAKWRLPGGGSPDMGGVSADGRVLWLSGRFDSQVYAIDTSNGRLLARIQVGAGPHGLSVWPQPGRYSLGHTGNMR